MKGSAQNASVSALTTAGMSDIVAVLGFRFVTITVLASNTQMRQAETSQKAFSAAAKGLSWIKQRPDLK